MKNLSVIIMFVILLATIGDAQNTVVKVKPAIVEKKAVELVFTSQQVVKNKPFSAESISESIQTLPDGNRIKRSSTVKMFRDSEGRFRREPVGNEGNSNGYSYNTSGFALGVLSANTISITDPVNSVRYTLDPKKKTAQRFENRNIFETFRVLEGDVKVYQDKLRSLIEKQGDVKVDRDKLKSLIEKEGELDGKNKLGALIEGNSNVVVLGNSRVFSSDPIKPESLGTKMIEGVEAEGTRTVKTIEAGAIGNELPIEITYEKWYSKELDMIVYSRNYDPRSGEKIYRLVNIDQTEPDISLFTVPSDYKIIEAGKSSFFEFSTKPKE